MARLKDAKTQQLSDLIKRNIVCIYETSRAEASLCDLSFQSLVYPERHVWIGVYESGYEIDLEDWSISDGLKQTVVSKTIVSSEDLLTMIAVWLLCLEEKSFDT